MSNLSVSSNGSTWVKRVGPAETKPLQPAFSILERIDVGETHGEGIVPRENFPFQYPRTDRRG